MPNSSSAEKRVRQNTKRRALNRWRSNRVKDAIRAFEATLHAGDVAKAETEIKGLYKLLDQVASTSTMHKNTASRYKSRLTGRLNAVKAGKKAA